MTSASSSDEPDRTEPHDPVVAVVMPAYNAAHLLPRTVTAAVLAAHGSAVLVVDPGSDDDSAQVAKDLGARVIRLGRRAGPAEARNEGVAEIEADVALFIDSDCVAHPDVVDRVREAFRSDPDLVSLTGSYDADPPEPGFFSQYMNLRHHHTHQQAKQDGASFWAGCGAVRVDTFRAIGGFDAEQFPRPMIEDIELGLRLRARGQTRLDPDLNVTHLKRWTLGSVVKTDITCRAIPWSRLILASGDLPDDLNTRTSQRVAAMVAPFALLSILALPLALWLYPVLAVLPAGLLILSLALNFDLFRFFTRRRGLAFGIGGWIFHQVHLFYSAATFACVALGRTLGSGGAKTK